MRDTTSYFPDEIDNRIYFEDTDLYHIDLKSEYDEAIKDGRYDEAKMIAEAGNLEVFNADILNLLENRLVTIGEFLPTIDKPKWTSYQNNEPSGEDVKQNYTWIGEEL